MQKKVSVVLFLLFLTSTALLAQKQTDQQQVQQVLHQVFEALLRRKHRKDGASVDIRCEDPRDRRSLDARYYPVIFREAQAGRFQAHQYFGFLSDGSRRQDGFCQLS